MNINKIKNFVIIGLVVTAVYQTGMLWLGDITSHNFFYTVFGSSNRVSEQVMSAEEILLPTAFVIGDGNRKFSVQYPSEESSKAIIENANTLAMDILNNGTLVDEITVANWEKIFASKSMTLQYSFFIPMERYIKDFNKSAKTKSMSSFNSLTILPAKNGEEVSIIYFVNTKTKECIQIELENSRNASRLYTTLELDDRTIRFVSTGQSGFNLFEGNVFVPQWSGESLSYSSYKKTNPFVNEGNINRIELENSIGGFFRNFAADWSTTDENGTFMFSDENVVVKYYPNDSVLEYYSYATYDRTENIDLMRGYRACEIFMKNDKSLQTSVFLTDVEKRNEEFIYYFDYTIDGFPVLFSSSLGEKMGMNHAIEIVVRNNAVKKYSRYVCNFEPLSSKSSTGNSFVKVDFLTALNEAILTYQDSKDQDIITKVEDMKLQYFMEKTDEVKLKWTTQLYDSLFIGETE